MARYNYAMMDGVGCRSPAHGSDGENRLPHVAAAVVRRRMEASAVTTVEK